MIHQHTMTQLKTVQDPMKLLYTSTAAPYNLTNTASASVVADTVTTTAPANSTSAIVLPTSSLNYIKIVPILGAQAAYSGQAIRVTGYAKTADGVFFVPQLLFYCTVTGTTTSAAATVNTQSMYPVVTITKQEGDAKIYNAATSKSGAFALVDTLGCQFVKIEFIASAASGNCNAFIGAI